MVACVAALRNCAAPAWPPPAGSCWISTPPPIPPMASRSSASTTALMIVASIIPAGLRTAHRLPAGGAPAARRSGQLARLRAGVAPPGALAAAAVSRRAYPPGGRCRLCHSRPVRVLRALGNRVQLRHRHQSCLSKAQPGAGGKSPPPLLAPRPAAVSLQQLPASQQALATALAPHLLQSRTWLRRQQPALCHHQPSGHRRASLRLLSAPRRMRKPHCRTQERICRRPFELSPLPSQCLSSAVARQRLQSGGAVSAPPALVAAPGANPDLAGTLVQTGSADHPLGTPGGGAWRQRLAFSTALAERFPGGGQRLKRFCWLPKNKPVCIAQAEVCFPRSLFDPGWTWSPPPRKLLLSWELAATSSTRFPQPRSPFAPPPQARE